MKLVYKTLHKKQAFLHAMLILLLFLSLLSLQITFTVFTKGQNMAERIDKMDVATTNIFYKEYDDEIKDFLQEYKEDGNLDFTYEESLVWPYGVFFNKLDARNISYLFRRIREKRCALSVIRR